MADVATRHRKKRRLRQQQVRENRQFNKFKKSAKYGSKLHRMRISQGILRQLYGRPVRGQFWKSKNKPKRIAGYGPQKKVAAITFFKRNNKRRKRARDMR